MKISISSFVLISLLVVSCGGKDKKNVDAPVVITANKDVKEVFGLARIEPEAKIAPLATPVSGVVVTVFKKENDTVKSGEVLVEIDHLLQTARLQEASSKLNTQRQQINAAVYDLKEFPSRINNKKKELERARNLLAKGAETQEVVDNLVTELSVLEMNEAKTASLLEVAKARLNEITQEINTAKKELDQYSLRAPENGVIIEQNAIKGAALNAQQTYAQFVPVGRMIAVCEIDELFADKVRNGQTAFIRLTGTKDVISTGKVIYAAPTLKKKSLFSEKAGDQEDRRVREVKISLDSPEKLLINSRVECVIDIK